MKVYVSTTVFTVAESVFRHVGHFSEDWTQSALQALLPFSHW